MKNQALLRKAKTRKEFALAYLSLGFSLVQLDGKRPVKKGWTNLPPTTEQLALQYCRGSLNFGIRTGKISGGVVVLDVDPKNRGQESLDAIVAKSSIDMSSVPRVRTGGGGYHFYFHFDEPLSNSVGRLGPGLDIRGEAGQVVAPPSIHPDTHKPYRWEIFPEGPLPSLPTVFVDLLKGEKPMGVGSNKGGTDFSEVLKGVPEGERDVMLFKYACSLRAKSISKQEAETLVITAARNCEPPFPEETAREKVDRIWRKYSGNEDCGPLLNDFLDAAEKGKPADIKAILPALASMSPLDYESVRQQLADAAGVRASVLDDEVEKLRPKNTGGDHALVVFPEVIPHSDVIDGAQLLSDISSWLGSYVVLPSSGTGKEQDTFAANAISAWVVATWLRSELHFAPILALISATKRSGKTTLLDLLRTIVFKGLLTSGVGVTPAIIFRLNEKEHPTFLIDEAEKLATDRTELNGLLNSGYRKGATVQRCLGDNFEIQSFDAYGFRALAAIKKLWDTVIDRSIVIPMKRKHGEAVRRFNGRQVEGEGAIIAAKIARWVEDNKEKIKALDGEAPRPDWLHDRAADNWSSLFVIGIVAGGNWKDKLISAAKWFQSQQGDESDLGELLLQDIEAIFKEKKYPRFIQSPALVDELNRIESSPWGDWKGKGYTTIKLASMLKRFDVRPRLFRMGNPVRGYHIEDFLDAFTRYIRDFQPVTLQQDNKNKRLNRFKVAASPTAVASQSCYKDDSVTSPVLLNLASGAVCNDVTSKNGKPPPG